MSELKTRFIDDTYAEYFNTGKHELAQIYLKSEADKLIAELKEHNENYRFDNNNMLHKIMKQDAEICHQKYKRCLAMARWCYDRWIRSYHLNKLDKTKFYVRWQKRWLELAEKLKEAK